METHSKPYIRRMRSRDGQLSKGSVQFVLTLMVETPGSSQTMNCVNTETMFRIIQSIPTPKAEPFQFWLAKVG
jgi:DNA-damage-inducible protein D